MAQLEELRAGINEIDTALADLFERRMRIAAEVAAYKRAQGLPVLDAAREQEVVRQGVARLQNPALAPYYSAFLEYLMGLSRAYQNELLGLDTVAYQGAEGGFGHQVMRTLYPHAKPLYCPTFADVFAAVQSGKAAFGVVPFENSNTGDVVGVQDLLYSHECYIAAMYDLPVTQNLLALPGATLADIKTVVSHQQALDQSRRFIASLGARPEPYVNTASAAKHVAETCDKTMAAIASLEAGERYGLAPLARDIATERDNTTRFIIISRQPAESGSRFSLLVTISNSVGALEKVISAISAEGMNMESIKSRPMPGRPWEYYFYIELVGKVSPTLMPRLEAVCVSARPLGAYERTAGTREVSE